MDDSNDPMSPDSLESLSRSKAQIEAGETVPMDGFLGRLRASIARMETRQIDQMKRSPRKA